MTTKSTTTKNETTTTPKYGLFRFGKLLDISTDLAVLMTWAGPLGQGDNLCVLRPAGDWRILSEADIQHVLLNHR